MYSFKLIIKLMKFRFKGKIFSHTININEYQFSIVRRGLNFVNLLDWKEKLTYKCILITTHIDKVFSANFSLDTSIKRKK